MITIREKVSLHCYLLEGKTIGFLTSNKADFKSNNYYGYVWFIPTMVNVLFKQTGGGNKLIEHWSPQDRDNNHWAHKQTTNFTMKCKKDLNDP